MFVIIALTTGKEICLFKRKSNVILMMTSNEKVLKTICSAAERFTGAPFRCLSVLLSYQIMRGKAAT